MHGAFGRFFMSFCGGQVTGVNAEKKLVKLADGKEVKYDNSDHVFYILSNKQYGRLGFFV